MTDKTEIEQVREALSHSQRNLFMADYYYKRALDREHIIDTEVEEKRRTWFAEKLIEEALQEKLERLENEQQKKIKNYIMTGKHCPKCGDKMILNYKSHECGECNYIHCSAEVFSMLPPAPKQGDK